MDSRAWKTVGEREDEQERMNRMLGIGDGLGDDKRMEWIVGTLINKENRIQSSIHGNS